MGRDVGALDVADLALEALVDDLVLLGLRELGRIAVVAVDELEQRRERRAQVEAEATAVTEVVDPGQLVAQVTLVELLRVLRVVRGGHEAPGTASGGPGPARAGRARPPRVR
jgi:hypothetical protein